MHTLESLQTNLHKMGLTGRETILVHSSMKSIGEVEGRAETVLDAFISFFQQGLLLFPTFTYASVHGGEGHNLFDADDTRTCVGILPELFRKRNGVVRSLHPTHSLAAWGPDAKDFVSDHEKYNTAFNRQGPFGRLLERKAKILLIGVTLDRCTFLHALEEWAGVPVLSQKPLKLISQDHKGTRIPVDVHWHKGAHSEVFDRILPVFSETGVVQEVRFGDAPSLLLDCRRAYDVLVPRLKQDPDFFHNEACPPQPE